jgi:hypothetical protein
MWEASDGQRFPNPELCENYEEGLRITYELQPCRVYGEISVEEVVTYILKNFVRKDKQ